MGLLGSLLFLALLLGGLLNAPFFQKFLADKAASYFSDYTGCEVSVGKVDLRLMKRSLRLWDLNVLDSHENSTVYAQEAWVVLRDLNFKAPALQSASLVNPRIRIVRYRGDSISDFKRVLRKIAARPKKDTSLRKPFEIGYLCVRNASFCYDARDESHRENGCVDFKHVLLQNVDLEARDFYTRCGVVMARIEHLSCREADGLEIEDFSSRVYANKGRLRFSSSLLRTSSSSLDMDLYLSASDWKSYSDFVDKVRIKARLGESVLELADLRRFVSALGKMQGPVHLSGNLSGPVSDMDLTGLTLRYAGNVRLDADIRMKGLPRLKDTYLELALRELYLDRASLQGIVLPAGKRLSFPGPLREWAYARVRGDFSGRMDAFRSRFDLESDLGIFSVGNTVEDTLQGPAVMVGEMKAKAVRLDKITGRDSLLGTADLEMDFRLSGTRPEEMDCRLEGKILHLQIDRKELRPIGFDLCLQKDFYAGNIACSDPNLDFRLRGRFDVRSRNSQTDYELDLRNIDLRPLRLMGDTGAFTVAARLAASHTGDELDTLQGRIRLENLDLHRLGKNYFLPYWEMAVSLDPEKGRKAEIRSDLLDSEWQGYWSFSGFWGGFRRILGRHLPALFDTSDIAGGKKMDLAGTVELKKPDSLLALFVPSLSIPMGFGARIRCDEVGHRMDVSLDVPYMQFGKIACADARASLFSTKDSCGLDMGSAYLYLDDSLRLSDFSLLLDGNRTDAVAYGMNWTDDSPRVLFEDTVRKEVFSKKSVLSGSLDFYPGNRLRLGFDDFRLFLGGAFWVNHPDSYLFFAKDSLVFHHVGLLAQSGLGGLKLEGELSHRPNSLLRIDFLDFELSYLRYFLRKTRMDMDGAVEGYAQVHDFYDAFSFDADLHIDSLDINGRLYGNGFLNSTFSRKDAVNVELRLIEGGQGKNKESLRMGGTYYPLRGNRLDFSGEMDGLPVDFLRNILSTVTKDLAGRMNGQFRIGGSLSDPELYAKMQTDDFSATIPVLETRYSFSDFNLLLTSERLSFEDCRFEDPVYKTGGVLSGAIRHRNFKDMRLDMAVDFNNMLVLNSRKSLDLPFWGTVFASGNLSISGPADDVKMLLSARVDENSDISFDFSNPSGTTGTNFITFISDKPDAADSGHVSFERFYARNQLALGRKSRLTMDLNMNVTPGLTVTVGLRNTAMSGTLKATGSGLLRLLMVNGNTQLFGTYTVGGGEFDFSMVDLINKRFVLEDGGTLSWVGPMTDARVDVRADYQTKASLYPVLASFNPSEDEARQMKQHVNVNSIIELTGNLMNPDIGFDIELVNTDEDTKDKFFAVVKKDDEDEMLRQTFSLLMFNSFMSVEGSSSGVGSTALSSSSDFLFSQFNNFLSKFTTDFNIGVNYKPRDQVSNSEFQVMMSGQLFDDRLLINGNLGVTDQAGAATAGASTVVGEVDVEWKFTEELRLKGFNHSNDQDLTKPANSYTQGVGIVFKRDFDNWKEFIHGTRPRRTKEEREADRKKKREIRKAKQDRENNRESGR